MSNNMSLKANSTPFGVQIPIFLAGHSGWGNGGGGQGMFSDPLVNGGLNPLSWPQPPITKLTAAYEQHKLLFKMHTCSIGSLMSEICACVET